MTTYEATEKRQARTRLRRICCAMEAFPDDVDSVLQETDLLELLRLAKFAGRELVVTSIATTVGNSLN